ncbi:HDOD domain-containing protein [Kaarinaea lacus]
MSESAYNSSFHSNHKGSVQDLVQGVVGLISLPDVCVRVKEMVDDPESSAADIGKVVSKDAALTARLLRIVNSAFYQFPSRIETVSRAITIVGNRELKDLVFAATVAGIFEKVSSDLIDIETFWRHAVYCGIVSRIIAQKSRVLHSERLFVAGLMHDIGRMVIAFKLPNKCRDVLRYRKENNVELHVAENSVLGFDHAQVGAELMKAWSLPQSHQLAALHHHSPEKANEFVLEASIVYLANIITELAEAGTDDVEVLTKVPDEIWRMTKVYTTDIEDILVEARDQFIDAITLIRAKEGKSSHYVA